MSNNREILNSLAPSRSTNWKEKLDERRKNKAWIRKSMDIALDILDALQEKSMTQKQLAQLLGVTPQTVSRTLSGKENLSLETIVRYEEILGISLIHTGLQKEEKVVIEKEYVFLPISFNSRLSQKANSINGYQSVATCSVSPWN